MKMLMSLCLAIFAYGFACAQNNSFFNYYADSIDGINKCRNIIQLNDTTLIVNAQYYNQPPINYYDNLIICNNNGVVNSIVDAMAEISKMEKYQDSNFVAIGGYLCPGAISLTLIMYNNIGDTTWTRCYPTAQYNWGPMGSGFAVCRDSGFIVSGYQNIVKLDKFGNVQWVSPTTFLTWDVQETIEGNFVVCGMGLGPYGVALYDSAGSLKWSQIHGTLYSPWLDYSATSVIQLPDSNYLVSCMNDTIFGTGVGWNLMKVNKDNGDTMQTFLFPWTNFNDWHTKIMYLSDSTIFCGCSYYFQHYDKNLNHLSTTFCNALLYPIDVYDFKPTSDRGIIGSGIQWKGNYQYEHGFYFKTDSNFQITNFTDIAEHVRENPLYVFPNPASDYFNVGLPYMPAPIFLTITVYDVYGKLCFTKTANSESELRINCNGWPSGLYVVRGVDRKGVVSLGKVLINN